MSADQIEEGVGRTTEENKETNKERRLARKAEKLAKRKAGTIEPESSQSGEISEVKMEGTEENEEHVSNDDAKEEEVEALSHKEMRKRRRLEKQAARSGGDANALAGPAVHPSRAAAVATANAVSTGTIRSSRHSVWVGNLSFRTNAERLQEWFEEKGLYGISRVNMPKGPKKTDNNRGFAYVDVPSADAVQTCIDLSESHLDGRRLLIKAGTDYSGRPEIDKTALALASGTSNGLNISSANATDGGLADGSTIEVPQKGKTGLTKTAQKILRAQKHSPGPTLFVGNLSFNSTEDGLRDIIERSAAAREEWSNQKTRSKAGEKRKKESRGEVKKKSGSGSGTDSGSDEESSASGEESSDEGDENSGSDEEEVKSDDASEEKDKTSNRKQRKGEGLRGAGIRKIRMGQFEDTGKCKGFAFIDFFTPEYATASLIDPRNSRLDGRELILQYAGADAVRRGAPKGQIGGPRPMRENNRRPPPFKRPHSDAFEAEEKPVDLGPAPVPGTFDPDAPMPKKHKETKEERIARRQGQIASSTKRAKPGAALANAPRGKTGIEFNAPKGVKKTFD